MKVIHDVWGLIWCNNYFKKFTFTSSKRSPKFAKFVLVQATQIHVLPLNGCPYESTLSMNYPAWCRSTQGQPCIPVACGEQTLCM